MICNSIQIHVNKYNSFPYESGKWIFRRPGDKRSRREKGDTGLAGPVGAPGIPGAKGHAGTSMF